MVQNVSLLSFKDFLVRIRSALLLTLSEIFTEIHILPLLMLSLVPSASKIFTQPHILARIMSALLLIFTKIHILALKCFL